MARGVIDRSGLTRQRQPAKDAYQLWADLPAEQQQQGSPQRAEGFARLGRPAIPFEMMGPQAPPEMDQQGGMARRNWGGPLMQQVRNLFSSSRGQPTGMAEPMEMPPQGMAGPMAQPQQPDLSSWFRKGVRSRSPIGRALQQTGAPVMGGPQPQGRMMGGFARLVPRQQAGYQ